MGETYAKLFGSITRSSIWLEDDQTLRAWVTLMALADRNGYVGASVAGLASTARLPVEIMRKALEKFLAPDPDSRSQEFEGRRIEIADRGWNLLNYERFRDMRDEDARRQIEREKKRRQRATKAAKRAAETAESPGTFPPCPAPSTTIPPLIGIDRSDPDQISKAADASPKDLDSDHARALEAPGNAAAAAAAFERASEQIAALPPVRTQPRNMASALELPIRERCQALLENTHLAQWVRPQDWPEITAFAGFFAKVAGQAQPKVSSYERDAGLKNAVQLFADGWTAQELTSAVKAAVASSWWGSGERDRGWSSLTPEVLRRAQNAQPKRDKMDPETAREIARTKALVANIGRGAP